MKFALSLVYVAVIVWNPIVSVLVENAAWPEDSDRTATSVPSTAKVTLPVGTAVPGGAVTVAVNVTDAPGADGFRELLIETERAFVPDRIQHNGDRRRLGLRVYEFRLESP